MLSGDSPHGDEPDGALLRAVTVEDDLLLDRLARRRDEAFEACRRMLADRNVLTPLVDVEPLFDGRTLYFYFLGPAPPEVETLVESLAETYDAAAQLRQFAETLTAGCGPDCGTEAGLGCGEGGCSTCAVAAACSPRGRV